MTLSEELTWRGFVKQTTYPSLSALDGAPIKFFLGADPSASSLTIGNLVVLMLIRRFIAHGHKATLLVGGATGLIGDPDGKKQERDLKTPEEIARNVEALTRQYSLILPEGSFEVVNNYDWFKHISYLDFLRDVGKYMSMTQLLDRDFIKTRIGEGGSGISYAEFSYSLIQGYDFLHLYRTRGVTLQLCGADQWGNSLSGVEMIRKLEGAQAHVYSVPLVVNKSTGVKFGKSEAGAVWLDAEKTSIYQFYQFWLNLDDEGVGEYIKIYTEITPDAYDELMHRFVAAPHKREAQQYLAEQVTRLVHGEERTQAVKEVTDVLFGKKSVQNLDEVSLDLLAREIPTIQPGKNVVTVLTSLNLAASNGAARRLLQSGAITIDGEKIYDDQIINSLSLLKKGKNSFVLVRA